LIDNDEKDEDNDDDNVDNNKNIYASVTDKQIKVLHQLSQFF